MGSVMDKDEYDEVCYINVFSSLFEEVKNNAVSYNDQTAEQREPRYLFSKKFISDITTPERGLQGEKPAFGLSTRAPDLAFYDYKTDTDVSELTSQQKTSYVELFKFVKYLEADYLFSMTNVESSSLQEGKTSSTSFTSIDNFFGSHYQLSRGNDVLQDTDRLLNI